MLVPLGAKRISMVERYLNAFRMARQSYVLGVWLSLYYPKKGSVTDYSLISQMQIQHSILNSIDLLRRISYFHVIHILS
jgi:hypothetical protein